MQLFENLLSTNNKEFSEYFKLDISSHESSLKTKPQNYWQTLGEKLALQTFHAAAERVPAYKDFLKKSKTPHAKVKTIQDFLKVPQTDKQNYIAYYPIESRTWDGTLKHSKLIASSSGTTGNPNYWPRTTAQELEAALTHELLFRNNFSIHKKKTLLIIGFPMGVYVSGMATVLPSWLVAQKYNMTVVSVGNNKAEVLKSVKNLYKQYEQVVLVGHPFFLKDVIESGSTEGIPWKKIHLNLMFCSEGFTEPWREYVMHEAGIKTKFGQTLSTYGSSEMLLVAYETPISILLKQLSETNPKVNEHFFTRKHTPSIFQYNPTVRYIESVNRELVFTSRSGLPLVRFNLHDSGTTFSLSSVTNYLQTHEPGWKTRLKSWPLWQLPFVTLWGRSDHTIVFYAANIYPEHIHAALHQNQFLKTLTGKFTLRQGSLKNMDEFLEINLELKPKLLPNKKITANIRAEVTEKLKKINMEYLFLWNNLNKDIRPKIKLWPYQHPTYFKPGLKPKYIA